MLLFEDFVTGVPLDTLYIFNAFGMNHHIFVEGGREFRQSVSFYNRMMFDNTSVSSRGAMVSVDRLGVKRHKLDVGPI